MIKAWIVVRKEKHVDDKFWVCLDREDALKLAKDVVDYWWTEYNPQPDEIDEKCYGDEIFRYEAEEMFQVSIQPQQIREQGEYGRDGT